MNVSTTASPPPPSPSASEAPPSYDSLSPVASRPPRHHQVPGGGNSSSSNNPTGLSLGLEQGFESHHHRYSGAGDHRDVVVVTVSEGEEQGAEDDPPPPYSPGLRNFFSLTRRQEPPSATDAPPTHNSLFGQILGAYRHSSSCFSFLRKLSVIVLNTIGCTILLVMFMSIPFAVLVLGVLYLDGCPLQPFLPIFLIVGGVSGIIKNLILITENIVRRNCTSRVAHHRSSTKKIRWLWRICNFIFNLFLFGWIVAGGYWVYSSHRQVVQDEYTTCNRVLYTFSFAVVTCSLVLLLLVFCCSCCLLCVYCIERSAKKRAPSPGGGGDQTAAAAANTRDNEAADVGVARAVAAAAAAEERQEGEVTSSTARRQEVAVEGVVSGGRREEEQEEEEVVDRRVSMSVSADDHLSDGAVTTDSFLALHSNPEDSNSESAGPLVMQESPPQNQQYQFKDLHRTPASIFTNPSMLDPEAHETSLDHPHSNPSMYRSHSHHLDPMVMGQHRPQRSSFNHSSHSTTAGERLKLYNTVLSDGYSITAV